MSVEAGVRDVARVGDLHIAYESAGRGEPAVMFVPGIFQDRSYFEFQLSHFAARRKSIVIELRGHGDSSVAPTATIDDFVADVIAVADAERLEGVVLCGHSMAAVVALKVAAQRPELVRGVVMLDGIVLFPEAVRQAGLTTLVPALATDAWLDAVRGYFSRAILDSKDPAELNARVMAAIGEARPEVARSFFGSVFESDYAAELTNARCPVLYIHAKAPTDLRRLSDLRPDAMIGQVVGSGHYLMLTVPDQVNAMIDRFLALIAK